MCVCVFVCVCVCGVCVCVCVCVCMGSLIAFEFLPHHLIYNGHAIEDS